MPFELHFLEAGREHLNGWLAYPQFKSQIEPFRLYSLYNELALFDLI
jgi:hypothetical protein